MLNLIPVDRNAMPDACPFWDRSVTLAVADASSVFFSTGISDKEATLRAFLAGDLGAATLFVAWTVKVYSVSLFKPVTTTGRHVYPTHLRKRKI